MSNIRQDISKETLTVSPDTSTQPAIAGQDTPNPGGPSKGLKSKRKSFRPTNKGLPYRPPAKQNQKSSDDNSPATDTLDPTTPVVPYFPVGFELDGIISLTTRYYTYLRGKDAKLADAISLPTLQYVLFLSIFARVKALRSHCGLEFYPDTLTLTQIASSIRLPFFLTKYVESIGLVKMANGAVACPTLKDDAQLVPFVEDIFEAGDRDFNGFIDSAWVVQYCDAIGRHEKSGIKFDAISFALPFNGREEFLVSYEEEDRPTLGIKRLKAFTPQILPGAVADLGSIYRFRTRDVADGLVSPLFEGNYFVEDALLSVLLR